MEVDMQSPPTTFRHIVPFAIKRPRSPGSPTQERQAKRLSLVPVGLEGHSVRRASTVPDGVADGRPGGQDDWVRQARELSIASPLTVPSGSPFAMAGGAIVTQSRVDEHMAVDDEESQALRAHVHSGSARPWSTRSHLPLIHVTTTATQTPMSAPTGLHAPSPAPFSVLTGSSSSSSESASPTTSIPVTQTSVPVGVSVAHPCPPDIFLFPATPSDTPSHQHQFAVDFGQQSGEGESGSQSQMSNSDLSQSSLPRTQDRADGSPRPSRAPDMPTSSGRKHRVTMGPRADCVKCRTGVRGHWMHFD